MRRIPALLGAVAFALAVPVPATATCVGHTSSDLSFGVCVIDICIGDPDDSIPDICPPIGYCPDPRICYEP